MAAGLSPWGVGTDTGGSVRIPASWCGVTAVKTSAGRVNTRGVIALSDTLDTPGPICRDVEDCAILFAKAVELRLSPAQLTTDFCNGHGSLKSHMLNECARSAAQRTLAVNDD